MNSVQVITCLQDKKNATEESGENLYLSVAFFLRESVPFYPLFFKLHLSTKRYASRLAASELPIDCKQLTVFNDK